MIAIGTFCIVGQTKQTVKLDHCGLWVVVGYFIDQSMTVRKGSVLYALLLVLSVS